MSIFSEEKSQAFCKAAEDGDLPLVKSLSLDPEVYLDQRDETGATAFFNACSHGHVDMARYLLDLKQRSIAYNFECRTGSTPLSIACENECEEVVEMLVEDRRIEVNKPDRYKATPLYVASSWGSLGTVKILLASTRVINTERKCYGKTAADIARERGEGPEEEFQERKKEYFDILSIITSYQKDPQAARAKLRRELGYDERKAGELFALVIFLSDGYLKIRAEIKEDENSQRRKEAQRFFTLASSLPLDIQMLLCNRVFGLGDSIVRRIHSEQGFKKFAREL